MRRTIYFMVWTFLAISSFSFVACKDDDDEKGKNPLLGVWGSEEAVPQYDEDEQRVTANALVYFQFNEDGTFVEKDVITVISNGRTYTETSTYGRWKDTGNLLKISVSFEDIDDPKLYLDEYEYTYRFAKDKLILTGKNENTGEIKAVSFVRGQMP